MRIDVGRLGVEISDEGWPHWTRVYAKRSGEYYGAEEVLSLSHDELRDLHFALSRAVAKLDEYEAVDLERRKRNARG